MSTGIIIGVGGGAGGVVAGLGGRDTYLGRLGTISLLISLSMSTRGSWRRYDRIYIVPGRT